MDRYEAMIAFASIVCGTILISTIVMSITRAVVAHRRASSQLPEGGLGRIEERLSRIEQAVDAIAVEVERVSEGQRFTTKLLSDRPAQRA